jgi:monoamine oxidase
MLSMQNQTILIIGAGAAGLMAARILAKAGMGVTVLEARGRCGGRIHTLYNKRFFKQAELGAEFIHGNLPVTLGLLNEAGIPFDPAGGEMWHYQNGRFDNAGGVIPYWDRLMKCLNQLEQDRNIHDFLQLEFPGERYVAMRSAIEKFASGYDTADPKKVSAFSLRLEWQNEDTQHRIKDGYGAMITYLENEFKLAGGVIELNSAVNRLNWQTGSVEALTDTGKVYTASKVLIALPLGVLQAETGKQGTIEFSPPIYEQSRAIQAIGFGAIIKILLEFDELFWEDEYTEKLAGNDPKEMGFVLSDRPIPTWWTQAPQHLPLLTGWLGGPAAEEKRNATEEELLDLSLQSVAEIFGRDREWLKGKLVAYAVTNWTKDPYTRGSYAYDMVDTPNARKLLNTPVSNALFFTGEYLYDGTAMGTVEAALTSGRDVAEKMIDYGLLSR